MTISVALIGVGHWGSNHLKALKSIQDAGLIANLTVCDSRPDIGEKIVSEYNATFTTSMNDVLVDEEIKAVILATPTSTHFSFSKRVLDSGKDVFVEKPLAYTTEQCDEIITLAEKQSRILMVGHIFRFHPAVAMLKEEIQNGRFGDIRSIDITRLALQPPRNDMGVLHALAIHDMDLACDLFGESVPKSVYAVAQSFYTENPDERSIVIMDFGKGRLAKVESSWLDPVAEKKRILDLIGSSGSAHIDFLKPQSLIVYDQKIVTSEDGLRVVEDGGKSEIIADVGMPLNIELEHFIECVKNRSEPITNGKVGRNAVRMIESAFESLKLGKPVQI